MTGVVIAIAVLAAVGLMVVIALRGRGAGPVEVLRVERRHDWEKRLTEQQEEALVRGVEKFRDAGHDLIMYHEGAKLDVFDPPMVVSLYALTDAFHKEGDAAKILERWAGDEQPGAMHLRRDYADQHNLSKVAHDLLSNARGAVEGIEHSGADELRGVVDLGVRADGSMNVLAVDLGRVADEVQRRREEDDKTPWSELVRRVLLAAIERNDDGVLWMRPPSAAERLIARRALETSTVT